MANPSIERIFTYHPPFGSQPQRYEAIRGMARAFGKLLEDSCPPSRERSLAITFLQQSVQMANASIAINEVEPAPAETQLELPSQETVGAAVV